MTVLAATWTPQSDLFDTQVGFQGMWLDAASGLYHTVNRDFGLPNLGRWIEQHPAGYVHGPSLYQTQGSNPATFVDPGGEFLACLAARLARCPRRIHWWGVVPGWFRQAR